MRFVRAPANLLCPPYHSLANRLAIGAPTLSIFGEPFPLAICPSASRACSCQPIQRALPFSHRLGRNSAGASHSTKARRTGKLRGQPQRDTWGAPRLTCVARARFTTGKGDARASLAAGQEAARASWPGNGVASRELSGQPACDTRESSVSGQRGARPRSTAGQGGARTSLRARQWCGGAGALRPPKVRHTSVSSTAGQHGA
jgi:hypothetical protein